MILEKLMTAQPVNKLLVCVTQASMLGSRKLHNGPHPQILKLKQNTNKNTQNGNK